jgi:hypothetical protein
MTDGLPYNARDEFAARRFVDIAMGDVPYHQRCLERWSGIIDILYELHSESPEDPDRPIRVRRLAQSLMQNWREYKNRLHRFVEKELAAESVQQKSEFCQITSRVRKQEMSDVRAVARLAKKKEFVRAADIAGNREIMHRHGTLVPDKQPKTVTAAEEAIAKLGKDWATVSELAKLTGRSEASIRSAFYRAKRRDRFIADDERELPDSGPHSAKFEYRIRGVWRHLFRPPENSRERSRQSQ